MAIFNAIKHFTPYTLFTLLIILSAPSEAGKGIIKVHDKPRILPNIVFSSPTQHHIYLSEYKGKWLLINIWATWCGPCIKELPSLDRLQKSFNIENLQIIAIAQDRGGKQQVEKYLDKLSLSTLGIYWDSSGKSQRDLRAMLLPTTILINTDGLEIARWIGSLEWDSPENLKTIEELLQK